MKVQIKEDPKDETKEFTKGSLYINENFPDRVLLCVESCYVDSKETSFKAVVLNHDLGEKGTVSLFNGQHYVLFKGSVILSQ